MNEVFRYSRPELDITEEEMENFAQKMHKDIYSRYVEPSGEIRQGLSERDAVNLLRTSELMDNTTYRTLMEILFAIDPDEKWERFCIGYLYPDYAWQERLCKSGKTNMGSPHEHNLKPPELFFKIHRLIAFHEMIFGDIVRNLGESKARSRKFLKKYDHFKKLLKLKRKYEVQVEETE